MEMRPGYRQTEVGIIPKDWATGTLEGVCLPGGLVRGPFGGAIKKEFFVRDGYKVYEQRNAIYREATLGSYFIDEDKYKELQRFELREGDFIVSCSGTIGRIFQIPKHARLGVINQALLKIKTDSRVVHDRFFFYVFDWDKFQQKIIDNTQGGAMHNLVGMDVFRGVHIPLPPLPEQRAIAGVLSDVDALITALDKLIAKKRDIKRAATHQLLTGKKRLPGFRGEWEVKSILELADRKKDLFDDGDWIEAEFLTDSGVRLIQTGNIGQGYFNETQSKKYISSESFVDLGCKEVHPGDILICRLAEPAGRACILPDLHEGRIITAVDVTIFRPLHSVADRSFLVQVFCTRGWFNEVNEKCGGTTRTRIARSELGRIRVKLPPLPEQRAIAAVLSDMDAEIVALQRRRDKTRALKQGMMQELLTGRIRLI